MGPKSRNHFTNLQCVRPIFEYDIVSTTTVSETVITKIQRVHDSFIRLALRLPKYVSARLLHKASGLPYVRERLISVGQNHLARMHANPLVEHTINSATTNIAWDKYKTPISILKGQLQRFHKLISNDRIWPSEHGFEVIFEKSLFVFEISAFKVRNKRGIHSRFHSFSENNNRETFVCDVTSDQSSMISTERSDLRVCKASGNC